MDAFLQDKIRNDKDKDVLQTVDEDGHVQVHVGDRRASHRDAGIDYLRREGKFKLRHPGNPAVLMLDLKMPKLDGYQVCKIVKNDPVLRDIPIILFTASSRHVMELSDRALELGAASCIKKPFDSKELLEQIKKLIG